MSFVRVRDESTGHEISVPEEAVTDGLTPLTGEVAVNDNGAPLPPKYAQPKPLDEQTVPELQQTAERSGVDLAGATKKAEIVAKITEETQK